MTESQVKSREAKVDFNEDIFEGEEAKTKNNFKRWNIWHQFQCVAGLKGSNLAEETTWFKTSLNFKQDVILLWTKFKL